MLSLLKVMEEGAERGEAARRLGFPSAAQAARRNGEGRASGSGEDGELLPRERGPGWAGVVFVVLAPQAHWLRDLRLRLAATALLMVFSAR